MIIIGYSGIGKSSACGSDRKMIDLESTFFHIENEEGWEEKYVNVAIDLSQQGYIVFVSSHDKVIKALKKKQTPAIDIIVICPSKKLKDAWIKKLLTRLGESILQNSIDWIRKKNLKAYLRVKDHYDEDISNLMNSGFPVIEITSEFYKLEILIDRIKPAIEISTIIIHAPNEPNAERNG